MNKEEKLKMYLTILNDENPSYVKENAKVNIIILFDKQQKQIEILKNNLKEERAFCKSTLETLKNCVDKDYLHKMISFKDGEIKKLKEAYQILKDDIEEHNIAYVDTPEFEDNYISKNKIKEKIEEIELNYFKANYTINELIEILQSLLEKEK